MEPNDPFASMVELCRTTASQASQFLLLGSGQDSEDDDDSDLDSGESTAESATVTTEELLSETDDDDGDDDDDEVNQNPIEEDKAYLYHTPPESSYSVSDSEVFHTPRRASSSSLPSSQNQELQPEGVVDGGGWEEVRREKLADDIDDEEEETAEIAVDLGADSDLGFPLAEESDSADGIGSNYSLLELPEVVDRGPEIKVICSESVNSRVSEGESVPDYNSSNHSGLTREMRIQKLKESLARLNRISEKQKRWKNSPVVGTPEASLCPVLSVIGSSMEESGSPKRKFVSLDLNVIHDAPRDSPEVRGALEMNQFSVIEAIPVGMEVDDGEQFRGVKRKLEFFSTEEMESDSEGSNSREEHEATRGTYDIVENLVLLQGTSAEGETNAEPGKNTKSDSPIHKFVDLSMNVIQDAPRDSPEASLCPELSSLDGSMENSGSPMCELISLSMNVIQDAQIDCSKAIGTLKINSHSMIEDIPVEMKVDDNEQSPGVKRKLEFFSTEEMESDSEESTSGKEREVTKGTHDMVVKLVLPQGTSAEGEKNAKSDSPKHKLASPRVNVIQEAPGDSPEASLCPELSSLDRSVEKSGSPKCELVSLGMNVIQVAPIDYSKAIGTLEINNHSTIEDIPAEMKVDDNGKFHGEKRKLEFFTHEMESVSEESNKGNEHKATKVTHDVVDILVLPQRTSAGYRKNTRPGKKVNALVGFAVLEFLKMFAEETNHGDPKLESMSLIDIAKMRGMTFP